MTNEELLLAEINARGAIAGDTIDRLHKLATRLEVAPEDTAGRARVYAAKADSDDVLVVRLYYQVDALGQVCRDSADEIALIIRLLETP